MTKEVKLNFKWQGFSLHLFLKLSKAWIDKVRITLIIYFATAIPPNSIFVEPITEERASRCMARIELLNKIRESVLWHDQLDEHLKLCRMSNDMPDWWKPGEHDKELLIGACITDMATSFRNSRLWNHQPKYAIVEINLCQEKSWAPHRSVVYHWCSNKDMFK